MMILYLFFTLLISGVEESQQTNTTDLEDLTRVETNLSVPLSTDSSNATLSLFDEEKSHIEEELQDNEVSVITEDEDGFMDQEKNFLPGHCQHQLLVTFSHMYCGDKFHNEMLALGSEKWCHLESVTRPYSEVTTCMERLTNLVGCYYPNTNTQNFFLSIHAHYFHNCTKDELVFEDAPHWVVMVLTLLPVSLIPVLVNLVVWKSKVQE